MPILRGSIVATGSDRRPQDAEARFAGQPPPGDPGLRQTRNGLLLVAALALIYIGGLWDCRGDCLWFDSGKSLYAPFRVLDGQAPYRDFQWIYPPLSPYIEAAVCRLFGATYDVLQGLGCVAAFLAVILLYEVASTLMAPMAAVAASLAFTMVATPWIGFVPYSYAATYANLLSLAAFAALCRHARDGRAQWLWLSGLAVGLCFAAKLEFAVGAAAGAVAYLWVGARCGRAVQRRAVLALALSALIGACAPYLAMLTLVGPDAVLRDLIPAWLPRMYHNRVQTVLSLLVLPASCVAALVYALRRHHQPERDCSVQALAVGFFIYGVVISLRALQASWWGQTAPAAVAMAMLLDGSWQRLRHLPVLRLMSTPRQQGVIAACVVLCTVPACRATHTYRLQTPRVSVLCSPRWGAPLDQAAKALASAGRVRHLVCLPYLPGLNAIAGIQSPLRQFEVLPGFVQGPAGEADAVRRLSGGGGAWVVVATKQDPYIGARFGLDYHRRLWSYIQAHYVTWAAWRGGRLRRVPPTPPRLEELAILAPRPQPSGGTVR